jgi:uncharacterized protein Yka (UPF0111/DUF47 family)
MAGLIDLFVPKEKKFYEYLDQQVLLLNKSSSTLDTLLEKKFNPDKLKKSLVEVRKNSADIEVVSGEIVQFLHKTFITPIDREEIRSLSIKISMIVFSIEKILKTVSYFKVKKLEKDFLKQIVILQESVALLLYVFEKPLSSKRNMQSLEQIKELEKKADDIYGKALGELLSNSHNAIAVIKQKELYDLAEDAIDDTRIVVDLLESILINNS